MNARSITLLAAILVFLWFAAVSSGHLDFGTPGVLLGIGLALVSLYWFFTDHPPIRR